MNQLSIIHPDTIECAPFTPVSKSKEDRNLYASDKELNLVSNMPFDEWIEFRNSDYKNYPLELDINSKTNFKNEKGDWYECLKTDLDKEIEERELLEREDNDAYNSGFQESIKNLYPPIPPRPKPIDINIVENLNIRDKIGDGEMPYIKDINTRDMLTNAWKAITFSNNWGFVAQDIETFMLSEDPRIYEITEKMEDFGFNGHSGCSFGYTMRCMQMLVQNGEEEFKKCFE